VVSLKDPYGRILYFLDRDQLVYVFIMFNSDNIYYTSHLRMKFRPAF
jgi:hypothetical protein